MTEIKVDKARHRSDVDHVKALADQHRYELGFLRRAAFEASLAKNELLVARSGSKVVGFVRYHHRRDHQTTLYEILTTPKFQRTGVGNRLIAALSDECRYNESRRITLVCPAELPANRFYEEVGFRRSNSRSREGKGRQLYQWEMVVLPKREIRFVASLTASGFDVRRLIEVWEQEAGGGRPFDLCIITPLFIDSTALECVRYIHDAWGVEVLFDSGGFFVQQGKIQYEDLFSRLLKFYCKHDWADAYVLPDYVPTSKDSPLGVTEMSFVTATEGVSFLSKLPAKLRAKAIGVLQGHTRDDLERCFNTYRDNGLLRLGFGSFDTAGSKDEINLFTLASRCRLEVVRELMLDSFLQNRIERIPDFHLFGVSSPNIITEFPSYLTTSFDSSGWQRTAGYGNVYLPFIGRRNVTHGTSSIVSGSGINASQFYAECERTGHACPFCISFKRLREDRFARMWHNALVFGEMTAAINRTSVTHLPRKAVNG